MARVLLEGQGPERIEVQLIQDEDEIVAACATHLSREGCTWHSRYDTWADAIEYASDHADRGVS